MKKLLLVKKERSLVLERERVTSRKERSQGVVDFREHVSMMPERVTGRHVRDVDDNRRDKKLSMQNVELHVHMFFFIC